MMPTDWEVVKLKDVCKKITDGSHFSPKEHKSGPYKIATVANMENKAINLESCKSISKEDYEKLVKNGCKPTIGDILFSKDGTVGLSFTYTQDSEIVLLSSIAIITPNVNINSHYCSYVLKAPNVFTQIKGSKRGTGLRRIILKDLKRIKIPLPSLNEQRKIAEILFTTDHAIQKSDEIITKTERLKKGMMQKLLINGIGHEDFKDTPLGRIPTDWKVSKMGDVIEICQYGLSSKMDANGNYPIIRMDELKNGYVTSEISKSVDLDEKSFNNFKLERGDVLFNRTNSYEHVGRTGIFLLDGEYVFASYLIRIRTKKAVLDPHFLTYYMIHHKSRLQQLATKAVSQANINATNLQNIKIPVPELQEQQKIVEIISKIDELYIPLIERKQKLQNVKKGLMNDLLTGRKRVKIDN